MLYLKENKTLKYVENKFKYLKIFEFCREEIKKKKKNMLNFYKIVDGISQNDLIFSFLKITKKKFKKKTIFWVLLFLL